jgi:hypothetical protein
MRQPSQAIRLYQFLEQSENGAGLSMEQLKEVAGVEDEQSIRNMLSAIRGGTIPHPSQRGAKLPRIPVYYDRKSKLYYRSDRFTDENVDEETPRNIYEWNLTRLLTHVRNLRESFIKQGLVKSIEKGLISDPFVLKLVHSVPEEQIWDLDDNVRSLGRAYAELRSQELARLQQSTLPAITGPTKNKGEN